MIHYYLFCLASLFLTVFGLEPRFNVVTRNVTIISGQTAVLPCSVDYLGDYKVVWLNHKSKLLTFEDRRIITDERISIERPYVKEWNLYIREVKPSDQGVYTCQINTDPVQVRPVRLQVQEPPKIIDHLSSTDVTVKEGDTVNLVCNVTGVPTPTVTWYRIPTGLREEGDINKDNHDKCLKGIGFEGEVLVIHNVTRYCDDIYECVASNSVPPSVEKQIRVLVQFPPEIRLPNKKIGQARGKETILECIISGYPQGVNIWRKDGEEIMTSTKYRIEIYDEGDNTVTLSLRITHIDRSDYGEYECMANNELGSDSETMTLYEYPKHPKHSTTTTSIEQTTRHISYGRQKPNWQTGPDPMDDNLYNGRKHRPQVISPPRSDIPPNIYGRNGHDTGYTNIIPGSSGQVHDGKSFAQNLQSNRFYIGLIILTGYVLLTR